MSRQNLVFDPSSQQWVPGETPRTMGVPFEGPVNRPLEVRVAALEQGMGGGDGGDTGKGFPYGSQWWMGYTIEGESFICIHNVLLHYNRGVIAHTVNPVGFSVGEGVARVLGFSLNFATGAFAQETRADLSGFAQTSDGGDGLFLFPVYKFIGTTMVADYVHGSNLGGL